jgi:TetR/AcrR family transcriptional regulator, transcriptional repressor of aconitase
MRDILAKSGLSAGTVYRYFSGKHQLITTIALQAATELRGTPAEPKAAEPPPSLLEVAGRTVARRTDRSSTSLSTTPYVSPNSGTVAVPAQ